MGPKRIKKNDENTANEVFGLSNSNDQEKIKLTNKNMPREVSGLPNLKNQEKLKITNKNMPNEILSLSNTKFTEESIKTERFCHNCFTKQTPFWRKDPFTKLHLCNACGLYARNNNTSRPIRERNYIRKNSGSCTIYKTCEFCSNYIRFENEAFKNKERLDYICSDCKKKYGDLNDVLFYEFNIYDNK